MKLLSALSSQSSALLRALWFYAPALLIMVAVYAQPYVESSELTRDPVVISGGSFYHGMISNFGILLWCATATTCLFSAVLLKTWQLRSYRYFLLCGGILTIVLLLDDLFMLHEGDVPRILKIRERHMIGTYLFLIASFLLYFAKTILSTSYLVLLSALCFLGLSVLFDALSVFTSIMEQSESSELEYLFEDGFKFLGIMGWFYYFSSTCFAVIKRGINKKYPIAKKEKVLEIEL